MKFLKIKVFESKYIKLKREKENYALGQYNNIEFFFRVIVTQAQGNINTATCHTSVIHWTRCL